MFNRKKSRFISFDEYSIDTVIGTDQTNEVVATKSFVLHITWILILISITFLFGRLVYLQYFSYDTYVQMSDSNRTRKLVLLAPRGRILDRNGKVLVDNEASFNLLATPADLPVESLEQEVKDLSVIIGLDEAEVVEKLKKIDRSTYLPVLIKSGLTNLEKNAFEAQQKKFLGFSLEQVPIRRVNEDYYYSHILGYLGYPSKAELENTNLNELIGRELIGKAGVEKYYENLLRGKNGVSLVQVDARGNFISYLSQEVAIAGNDIELTIDAEMQKHVYESFTNRHKKLKGAAVVMDVKTGEVLASVSIPSYSLDAMTVGNGKLVADILKDPGEPLFNRVVAGLYPPGSTMKPLLSIAALMEGVVTERTIINDTGVVSIPSVYDPKIVYKYHGWKRSGLGPMDIYEAIAKSSDIYFYAVAGGIPGMAIKGLGAEAVAQAYKDFNFGQVTGIDLPGEKKGLVPDPKWKSEYYKDDKSMSKWHLGNTYHLGIGQGDLLVTPIQLVTAIAALANNGIGYKPTLLKSVMNVNGKQLQKFEPKKLFKHNASGEVFRISQNGMRRTVVSGSAKQLNDLPFTSAGKTGTSQFDGSDPSKTHALFTVYAPFEDPKIALTIIVEAGGEGHAAAVPIARETLEWWYNNRYNK